MDLLQLILYVNLNYKSFYHTYDSPEVSDNEYDELYLELKNIEIEYPSIIKEYSPTQRIGSSLLESFEKRNHEIPMLSLSNAASKSEFDEFYTKILTKLKKK